MLSGGRWGAQGAARRGSSRGAKDRGPAFGAPRDDRAPVAALLHGTGRSSGRGSTGRRGRHSRARADRRPSWAREGVVAPQRGAPHSRSLGRSHRGAREGDPRHGNRRMKGSSVCSSYSTGRRSTTARHLCRKRCARVRISSPRFLAHRRSRPASRQRSPGFVRWRAGCRGARAVCRLRRGLRGVRACGSRERSARLSELRSRPSQAIWLRRSASCAPATRCSRGWRARRPLHAGRLPRRRPVAGAGRLRGGAVRRDRAGHSGRGRRRAAGALAARAGANGRPAWRHGGGQELARDAVTLAGGPTPRPSSRHTRGPRRSTTRRGPDRGRVREPGGSSGALRARRGMSQRCRSPRRHANLPRDLPFGRSPSYDPDPEEVSGRTSRGITREARGLRPPRPSRASSSRSRMPMRRAGGRRSTRSSRMRKGLTPEGEPITFQYRVEAISIEEGTTRRATTRSTSATPRPRWHPRERHGGARDHGSRCGASDRRTSGRRSDTAPSRSIVAISTA